MAILLLIGFAFVAVLAWLVRDRRGAAELLAQAQADFQAGRFLPASDALDQLARLREPMPIDRLARAEVDRGLNRPDEALEQLAKIPDADTLAPIARTLAGRIELKRGRTREAEAFFRAALAINPGDVQAHRELAYLFNVQHRRSEFDREMDALSAQNALTFEQVLHWGKTRNAVWNPRSDAESLKGFLAADPEDRRTRLTLADAYRQMGQLDQADETLGPLPDSDREALALRAQVALERGDRDRTHALLADAPADHPDLARVRGKLALAERKFDQAIAALKIALAADPDDRSLLVSLATALRSAGDTEGAKAYQDSARRHDALTPLIAKASSEEWAKDPTLALRLAAACEATGRRPEARAWYRLAIARNPLDTEAQRGLYRLGQPPAAPTGASSPD